jgi:hypothetical protein
MFKRGQPVGPMLTLLAENRLNTMLGINVVWCSTEFNFKSSSNIVQHVIQWSVAKKAADIINQTGIFANGTEKKNPRYFWAQIYIKEE